MGTDSNMVLYFSTPRVDSDGGGLGLELREEVLG